LYQQYSPQCLIIYLIFSPLCQFFPIPTYFLTSIIHFFINLVTFFHSQCLMSKNTEIDPQGTCLRAGPFFYLIIFLHFILNILFVYFVFSIFLDIIFQLSIHQSPHNSLLDGLLTGLQNPIRSIISFRLRKVGRKFLRAFSRLFIIGLYITLLFPIKFHKKLESPPGLYQ